MKNIFKGFKSTMRYALALLMVITIVGTMASASVISSDGRYYTDYDSYEDTIQAAAAITQEVAAEGQILLKNTNAALPLTSKGNVTIFGISQVNVIGAGSGGNFSSGTGGMSIADALVGQGFVVNERITNAYKAIDSTTRGDETPGLELFVDNPYYEQTYANNNDVAIIIISRDCAEGGDKSVNTGELSAADAAPFDAARTYIAGDVVTMDDVAYKFVEDHAAGEWDETHVKKTYSQMKHAYPATVNGVAYKHELQFSDSEEDLIQYVEAQGFEKIVLVMNTSNNFELADADSDENIDAIIWMGRPGRDGLVSFAKILTGDVNPSGRTVDLFFSDFTKDPTWQNVLTNTQVGSTYTYTDAATQLATPFDTTAAYSAGDYVTLTENDIVTYYQFVVDHAAGDWSASEADAVTTMSANGVEYEEDIYLGYRFAETAANEENFSDFDYDTDVLYPFGYGLSYSTFSFNSIDLYAVEGNSEVPLSNVQNLEEKLTSGMNGTEANVAEIKQIIAKVEVENTGDTAGKQTVEIYVNAPYLDATTSTQKAYVILAGFGKTDILKPGAKEVVEIVINVQDFASYDAAGILNIGSGYTLEMGQYNVMALSDSHAWDDAYVASGIGFSAKASFSLNSNVLLGLDDYTDNPTENLFSAENGMFYTIRTNDNATSEDEITGDWGYDTPAFNANDNDPMTQLIRGDFANTMPAAPTADALTISAEFIEMYNYWYDFVLDGVTDTTGAVVVDPSDYATAEVIGEDGLYVEKDNMPWLAAINEFMVSDRYQTITQRETTEGQIYSLTDMAGIDPTGSTPLTAKDTDVESFIGLTGQEAWDLFLNDLTWYQLVDVVTMQATNSTTVPGGSYLDYGIEGNGPMSGIDSPLNLGSTYQFADNPTLAATFNTDLARRQGEIVGNIALAKGNNRWWGPTVNLHRTPFSGRAHEYFSSDPLLCGSMAYSECTGAQSRGLACCPKHAILNEQETGRSGLMSWASEQAIRELYAKPLQMLVQEGEGLGTMGAMNRIGTLHNYGNYNFITGLLHDEWNMRGSYTTDMGGSHGTMNPELMVRAGLNDVNNGKSYFSVGVWDATLRDGQGDVVVASSTDSERESFAQYYSTRYAAMWCLYVHANSAMADNGYDATAWAEVIVADGAQGMAYTTSVAIPASINAAHAVYSGVDLPAGLSLDPNTGALTGTPTAYGDFTFTINAELDSWINISAVHDIHIEPAFVLDALVADEVVSVDENVINAKAGDEVIIDAISDHIVATPIEVNARYKSLIGLDIVTGAALDFYIVGELPAGLELDEYGSIYGFVEAEPGSYTFTLIAKHSIYNNCLQNADGSIVPISMGPINGVLTINEYEIPVTIVVQ